MNRQGFTMVELLMVIIILGVVGTMAMPNFSGMRRSTAANTAAQVVRSDMERAFSEAAKNRRPVQMVFTVASRSYVLRDRSTSTNIVTRQLGSTGETPITSMTATPATVTFFPSGVASGQLDVRVIVGDQTRRILMSRVGLIRVTSL